MPTKKQVDDLERFEREQVLAEWDSKPDNMDNLNPYTPKPSPEEPFDFSAGKMVGNIPGSVAGLAEDITYPIRHPIKTAESLTELTAGLIQMAIPGGKDTDVAKVEAVGKHLMERYGSWENIKKTLESDPAGLLTDAMGIISGGGTLAAKIPGKVGQTASTIAKTANALDPINVAATTVIEVPSKFKNRKRDPIDEMLDATKFGTRLDIKFGVGTRRRLAETMLEKGYSLDDAGIAKMQADMAELGLKMEDILNSPAATTNLIPPQNIPKKYVPELTKKRTDITNWDADANRAAIASQIDPWLETVQNKYGNRALTIKEINKLKQDAYKRAGYDKGDSAADDIAAQTNKALGRSAKDIVDEALPDIKQYNDEWGRIAELEAPLIQAAGRTTNNTKGGGLIPLMKAGVAGVVGGSADPILGAAMAAHQLSKSGKSRGRGRASESQKLYDQQQKSYGDLYASRGRLPNLLTRMYYSGRVGSEMEQEGLLDNSQVERLMSIWD